MLDLMFLVMNLVFYLLDDFVAFMQSVIMVIDHACLLEIGLLLFDSFVELFF